MHITKKQLGKIIKNARLSRGWTQSELAERIDVSLRHMMGIENEGRGASFDILAKLIHELDLPPDHIFRPKQMPHTAEQSQAINDFLGCSNMEQRLIIAIARSAVQELRREDKRKT